MPRSEPFESALHAGLFFVIGIFSQPLVAATHTGVGALGHLVAPASSMLALGRLAVALLLGPSRGRAMVPAARRSSRAAPVARAPARRRRDLRPCLTSPNDVGLQTCIADWRSASCSRRSLLAAPLSARR
jgi:hypothetical protein